MVQISVDWFSISETVFNLLTYNFTLNANCFCTHFCEPLTIIQIEKSSPAKVNIW